MSNFLNVIKPINTLFICKHYSSTFNEAIKKDMKLTCKMRSEAQHKEHINTLVKLAENENSDAIWKSYIFDLKKGTMKFCLNAATNILPTGDNLFMWGKSTTDKGRCHKHPEGWGGPSFLGEVMSNFINFRVGKYCF